MFLPLLLSGVGCDDSGADRGTEPEEAASGPCDPPVASALLVDEDGDGFLACEDCDDTWSSVHPGAVDWCDAIDQDCNGVIDDGVGTDACVESNADWAIREDDPTHEDGEGLSISGDLDGDGRSDLLVGSGYQDGLVQVFLAANLEYGASLASDADWTLTGPLYSWSAAGGNWGGPGLSFVPDLDGDGRSEFLVGAPLAGDGDYSPGAAYLIYAASLGEDRDLDLDAFADVRFAEDAGTRDGVGASVGPAGDVDGDGVGDLLIGTSSALSVLSATALDNRGVDLIRGKYIGPPAFADCGYGFSSTGRSIGDVDGDGLGDLVAACTEETWGDNPVSGRVYLFLGESVRSAVGGLDAGDADLTAVGDTIWRLGASTVGGADVDGDGLDDWGAASWYADAGIYLFYRAADRLGSEITSSDADAHLTSIADGYLGREMSFGDFDGDGRVDLAADDDYPNQDYFVFGNGQLRGETDIADAAWHFEGPRGNDQWSGPVRMDGDLDADSKDDLAIGRPEWADCCVGGAVFVMAGR